MTFGAIFFLYALPLAGLPLVFHLLMKRKQRQLQFSTFMFFLRSDPRLAARRRLRELLLLVLRILFIAAALIALSRPLIRWGGYPRGPQMAAIVIDNSASMSAPGTAGESNLRIAIAAARRLIESLDTGSMVALSLLVEDPSLDVPHELSPDRSRAVAALDGIRPTEATGNPENALRLALKALTAGSKRFDLPCTLHVFTDLQATEWDRPAIDLPETYRSIDSVIHRLSSPHPMPPNALIESVVLPKRRVMPGHTYRFEVGIRNDSDRPLNLRVGTEDNLRNRMTESLALPPRELKSVTAQISPTAPGMHWVKVEFDGDQFEPDNRIYVGVACNPPVHLLFGGAPSEFGLLPTAVSPAGDGRYTAMTPAFCSIESLPARMDALDPSMVIVPWRACDLGVSKVIQNRLENYMRGGGNLLVVPHPGDTLPGELAATWIDARPLPRLDSGEIFILDVLDRGSDLWGALRGRSGKIDIRYFTATRFHPLDLSTAYHPILGRGFAEPVIAGREFGEGHLYVSGLAFDPAWTSLANDPTGAGMILIHSMALRASDPALMHNLELRAGRRLKVPGNSAGNMSIVSLVGDPMSVTLAPESEPVFPRTGVFRLSTGTTEYCLWVRPSVEEGKLMFLPGDRLESLDKLSHRVVDVSDAAGWTPWTGGRYAGFSLFFPVLLLAMLLWMAESWVETQGRLIERESSEGSP